MWAVNSTPSSGSGVQLKAFYTFSNHEHLVLNYSRSLSQFFNDFLFNEVFLEYSFYPGRRNRANDKGKAYDYIIQKGAKDFEDHCEVLSLVDAGIKKGYKPTKEGDELKAYLKTRLNENNCDTLKEVFGAKRVSYDSTTEGNKIPMDLDTDGIIPSLLTKASY